MGPGGNPLDPFPGTRAVPFYVNDQGEQPIRYEAPTMRRVQAASWWVHGTYRAQMGDRSPYSVPEGGFGVTAWLGIDKFRPKSVSSATALYAVERVRQRQGPSVHSDRELRIGRGEGPS